MIKSNKRLKLWRLTCAWQGIGGAVLNVKQLLANVDPAVSAKMSWKAMPKAKCKGVTQI